MKFIFPQNYHFKNKFLGIIEYSALILNIIWDLSIFFILHLVCYNTNMKIFVFVVLCLPILLFSIIGFNHENLIDIFRYLLKYIKSPKLYLYNKKNEKFY
jgi:hypothetical protein